MALPSSGTITLAQIQTEFGGSNPIGLNEYYRGGAYVTTNNTNVPTSGMIRLSDFYGAVKQFEFTLTTNYNQVDMRVFALYFGWNGTDPVLANIAAGVVIGGQTVNTAALTVSGSFPNGVTLVNNGTIVGMGGAGGAGNAGNGSFGGAAIYVYSGTGLKINNAAGTIAGGGGGGGGGSAGGTGGRLGGGGGGGGGRSSLLASAGGAGGGAPWYPGAAGAGGSYSAAGGGGAAGYPPYGGAGGAGGGWGAAGSAGLIGIDPPYQTSGAGGAAGAAVTGPGAGSVVWLATGTRYGTVS